MEQIFEAFHVKHKQGSRFELELIEIDTKENLQDIIKEFECAREGHFWIYPRDERMQFDGNNFKNTTQSWEEVPIAQRYEATGSKLVG